jgi:hypothetical protein
VNHLFASARRGALVLLCLGVASLATAGTAAGAPVAYFPVPGSAAEPISNLTVGSPNDIWVTQQLAWGPSNEERQMRLLRFDSSGSFRAATSSMVGDPVFTEIAPSSDGGVWVLASAALQHVATDGTTKEIELPERFGAYDLVAGLDGRAWALICRPELDESLRSEECRALGMSTSGETESFLVPQLAIEWPSGASFMVSASWAVPVQGGIWIVRAHAFEGDTEWSTDTVFVSYAGDVHSVDAPSGTYVVEAATGNAAWWIQEHSAGGATIGQIETNGFVHNVEDLKNVSAFDPPDPYSTAAGRNGDLLWAQNATWSDVVDGQLGVRRVDGTSSVYSVGKNATSVLIDEEANFWSGACVLGSQLYEAADGSIWTLSFGHPSRITRQQPSGEFSVFLLGDQVSRETETEGFYGIGGLAESDIQSLWFTRNTSAGPQLARLNPLDPPPPEVRYPGNEQITGGRPLTRRQQTMRLLRSLLAQSERALLSQRRLWLGRSDRGSRLPVSGVRPGSLGEHKSSFQVRGRFPVAGRAAIRLQRRGRHRKPAVLAYGAVKGGPGRHSLVVNLTPAGRKAMRRRVGSGPLRLQASFDAEQAGSFSRSSRIELP